MNKWIAKVGSGVKVKSKFIYDETINWNGGISVLARFAHEQKKPAQRAANRRVLDTRRARRLILGIMERTRIRHFQS